MWVLDYLEEIDSDMSVFHRVDDARATMPAPLYFERAALLSAYDGIMRIRAHDNAEQGDDGSLVDAATTADGDWIGHDTGGGA